LELDLALYMSWSFFSIINGLRWEMILIFVDIGGIVEHHCLNVIFKMTY
jgi:hypothetical protein